MAEFLSTVLSFPTVVFSGLLGLVLVYWLFVIVGALDVDIVPDGFFEGAAEGSEGFAEGAAEGFADGAAEGFAEGAAEGAVEGATEGAAEGMGAGLLGAFSLRNAPVTVVASCLVFYGWILSYVGSRQLLPALSAFGVPTVISGLLLMVAALVVATPLAGITTRPLKPIFTTHKAQTHRDLLGKVVEVRTGTVTPTFGQAILDEGGGLTLDITAPEGNGLKRGDQVMLIDYDQAGASFVVEPLDAILGAPKVRLEEGGELSAAQQEEAKRVAFEAGLDEDGMKLVRAIERAAARTGAKSAGS